MRLLVAGFLEAGELRGGDAVEVPLEPPHQLLGRHHRAHDPGAIDAMDQRPDAFLGRLGLFEKDVAGRGGSPSSASDPSISHWCTAVIRQR
jgi:hypothetical protein